MKRRLVIVSGAPGAGKTTLAVPLAAHLRYPLFSKDFIKETLVDVLGDGAGSLEASRRLGGAAMELLWSLAARTPFAVLEANFRPHSDYELRTLRAFEADIVEVHCYCGPVETARRFAARAATSAHHTGAHPLRALPPDMMAEYDRPMGVGATIAVDTTRPIDIPALALDISDRWGS
jgi:predicted kinase